MEMMSKCCSSESCAENQYVLLAYQPSDYRAWAKAVAVDYQAAKLHPLPQAIATSGAELQMPRTQAVASGRD